MGSIDIKDCTYEIVYFNENYVTTSDETETFAVYLVNKDKTYMSCYKDVNVDVYTSHKLNWFKYMTCGHEKEISEEEVFTLFL